MQNSTSVFLVICEAIAESPKRALRAEFSVAEELGAEISDLRKQIRQ